jgi:hypothetical protein
VGRDCSVGIATSYGLGAPGNESRWGRDFPHPSRVALEPKQPPSQWVPGLSPGEKRPGRGVDSPPLSSLVVKERVQLYLYSISGPTWPVIGWILRLPFLVDCRAQRQWVLRRGPAAARLLGLWVRIPLEAWISVCCVLSGRGLCRADHSSRGVLPSVVCLNEFDHEASIMRRPWPTGGCCAIVKKKVDYIMGAVYLVSPEYIRIYIIIIRMTRYKNYIFA